MREVDIAIVGAGPAGLAAAAEAAAAGASAALIDMNARLGGQYWRHAPADDEPGAPAPRWHHGWGTYASLAKAVRAGEANGRIHHLAETHVWAIDRVADGFELQVARTAEACESGGHQQLSGVRARRLILATGAYDRQLPVPGWDLPGVMAAGGIQAFIKVQGVAPGRRVVLAGTGPFLLAAANSVLQAGGEVAAIVESSTLTRWFPRGALGALVPSKGPEGAQYAAALVKNRVPYLTQHAVTEVIGNGSVTGVRVAKLNAQGAPQPGTERTFSGVDLVGFGWGFTPQTELITQLGAQSRLDVDGSPVGVVDQHLESTVPGLFLAGELTGVKGAAGAVADGRIAGRAAAKAAPRRRDLATRARHAAFAQAMHRAHPVPDGWSEWLTDHTTICRCEEVRYAEVRSAITELHSHDPRRMKGSTRVGMGFCQGRICGFAAQCLTNQVHGNDAAAAVTSAEHVSKRPLALPIELGKLADHELPD